MSPDDTIYGLALFSAALCAGYYLASWFRDWRRK
jgi:hypothetical protein